MTTAIFEGMRTEASALGERNDCAVKALAVALGVGYARAHSALAASGRKPRCATPAHMTNSAARRLGYELVPISLGAVKALLGTSTKSITVGQLTRRPDVLRALGPCLIRVSGHIIGAREGAIHDWADGRRFRVAEIVKPVPTP